MATQKPKTKEQRRARRDVRQAPKPPCSVHAFQEHGAEAEELRAGIEGLMAMKTVDDENGEPAVLAVHLQELLDTVDARDSLVRHEPAPPAALDWATAYVRDRAYEYVESSGIHSALLEVASRLERGEHVEAAKHGELDDLLEEIRGRRTKRPRRGAKESA